MIYVGREKAWAQTAHEANASLAELHTLGLEVITVRRPARGRRLRRFRRVSTCLRMPWRAAGGGSVVRATQ